MELKCGLLLALCFINLLSFVVASSEDKEKSLSTSISGMVQLLATEKDLIDSIDKYAALLQQKVDTLKKWVKSEKCCEKLVKKKKRINMLDEIIMSTDKREIWKRVNS